MSVINHSYATTGFLLCLACQGAKNVITEKPEHAKLMNSWLVKYGITETDINERLKYKFWRDIFPTRRGH